MYYLFIALITGIFLLPLATANGKTSSSTKTNQPLDYNQYLEDSFTEYKTRISERKKIKNSAKILVESDSSLPTSNPSIIITQKDIKASHASSINEILAQQPEITLSNNGGYGQNTLIKLNGASSQHIQILLNGMQLNDPSNISPFFDIGQIPLNFIESIEIITGANSVKYGSGAIAGVINIKTIHHNKTMATLDQSIGSFATIDTNAGLNVHLKDVNITLFGTLYKTSGYSVAYTPIAGQDLENDASNIKDFNMNVNYQVNKNNSLEFFYKLNNSYAEYDSYSNIDWSALDAEDNYVNKNQNLGYLKYNFNLFHNRFNNHIALSTSQTQREYHELDNYDDKPYSYNFDSQNQQLKYDSTIIAVNNIIFNTGFNLKNEEAIISNDEQKNSLTSNIYLITQEYLNGNTFLEQGISKVFFQHDTDLAHQTDSNYAYNLGLNYTDNNLLTSFKLNYGTAYRNPSLYELYSSYGNSNLHNEKSQGFNFYINNSNFSENISDISINLYYLQVDNLISWVNGLYDNLGNYTNYGVNLSGNIFINNKLKLVPSYAYLNSQDTNGAPAPLTPKHKVTLNVLRDIYNTQFNLQFIYSANMVDLSTGSPKQLDNYLITNLITTYKIKNNSNLYFKIENLFNVDYITSYGYSSSSRAYYLGLLFNV